MAIRNTSYSYGWIARFFHWVSFFWISALIIVGFCMERLPKAERGDIYNMHKLAGIALLCFISLRLLWTLTSKKPTLPDGTFAITRKLAGFSHFCLYLLIFMMPISGWIMATASGKFPHLNGISIPMPYVPASKACAAVAHFLHTEGIWLLLSFLALHILAALKHRVFNRDRVYQRMMTGDTNVPYW